MSDNSYYFTSYFYEDNIPVTSTPRYSDTVFYNVQEALNAGFVQPKYWRINNQNTRGEIELSNQALVFTVEWDPKQETNPGLQIAREISLGSFVFEGKHLKSASIISSILVFKNGSFKGKKYSSPVSLSDWNLLQVDGLINTKDGIDITSINGYEQYLPVRWYDDPFSKSIISIDDLVTSINLKMIVGEMDTLLAIKDYDGNLHGFLGDTPSLIKSAYKYQGKLDVNNDGTTEAIFTNKESGRWVTASIDPITGTIDYSKYGQGGTTRIVGIYEDPLVKAGIVEKDSPNDGSRTFINDLKLDNLILKTVGDYDGDGFQEVYWSKVDNTAYLRAVMHTDGNIQYANYQNLDQMTDYLTSHDFADTVALIA